jgi:hypothetical protein
MTACKKEAYDVNKIYGPDPRNIKDHYEGNIIFNWAMEYHIGPDGVKQDKSVIKDIDTYGIVFYADRTGRIYQGNTMFFYPKPKIVKFSWAFLGDDYNVDSIKLYSPNAAGYNMAFAQGRAEGEVLKLIETYPFYREYKFNKAGDYYIP